MNEHTAITAQPSERRPSPPVDEMSEVIAEWMATPQALREHTSLKALAEAHNWPVSSRLYEISNSSEVLHRALIVASAPALERTREILDKLADRAVNEGSIRAAEVWLHHNRTLLTDDKLFRHYESKVDPEALVSAAVNGAKEITQFVSDILKEERKVDESVEAEWSKD